MSAATAAERRDARPRKHQQRTATPNRVVDNDARATRRGAKREQHGKGGGKEGIERIVLTGKGNVGQCCLKRIRTWTGLARLFFPWSTKQQQEKLGAEKVRLHSSPK